MPGETPGSPSTPDGGGIDASSWRMWWSFNHEAYLALADRIALTHVISGENRDSRPELVRAFREHALPVLRDLLVQGDATDVLREVLHTIGRLGDDPELCDLPSLDHYSHHFLSFNMPSLWSGAVLALGVRGDASAIPFLRSLLADTVEGRRVVQGRPVHEQERALAAYALGLLASSASRETGLALTADLLDGLDGEVPELQVASALALGRIEVGNCGESQSFQFESRHICREVVLEALSAHAFDAAETPAVRAHATSSLGRLAAGAPALRATAAEMLLELLGSAGDPDVLRSAVIALGTVAGGLEVKLEDQVRLRLQELVSTGEPAVQRLALMAMSEAAGRLASRGAVSKKTADYLVRQLERGKRSLRPWAALAIGVLGHGLLAADQSIDDVALALRKALQGASNPEEGAAAALALGILRQEDPGSAHALFRLHQRSLPRGLTEPATLALGLLRAQEARELLRERFEQGDARAAVALLLLGERDVGGGLGKAIDRGTSPEMVRVLALCPEPETVAELSKLLADRAAPHKTRAAAAAALGELLDLDRLHWSAAYANGLNYFAFSRSLAGPAGEALLEGRPWQ